MYVNRNYIHISLRYNKITREEEKHSNNLDEDLLLFQEKENSLEKNTTTDKLLHHFNLYPAVNVNAHAHTHTINLRRQTIF